MWSGGAREHYVNTGSCPEKSPVTPNSCLIVRVQCMCMLINWCWLWCLKLGWSCALIAGPIDVVWVGNFDRPPEAAMLIVQHSLVNTKRYTMTSMTFHHTPTTTTQPTSRVDGANPPPHNQQPPCRHQSQHQLAHTCTAYRRQGTPTRQIRINWLKNRAQLSRKKNQETTSLPCLIILYKAWPCNRRRRSNRKFV